MANEIPWQQILADALAERPLVGVNAEVRRWLGRPATRAELSAARRAANRYATQGLAIASLIPGSGGTYLVLGRHGVTFPDEWPDEVVHPTRRGQPRSQLQELRSVARGLQGAARTARRANLGLVEAVDALLLAEDLEESITELEQLARRLRRRGQTGGPRADTRLRAARS